MVAAPVVDDIVVRAVLGRHAVAALTVVVWAGTTAIIAAVIAVISPALVKTAIVTALVVVAATTVIMAAAMAHVLRTMAGRRAGLGLDGQTPQTQTGSDGGGKNARGQTGHSFSFLKQGTQQIARPCMHLRPIAPSGKLNLGLLPLFCLRFTKQIQL